MPKYSKEFIQYVNGLSLEEEYYRIFGREAVGKIMCPFHPNENTPAAKVYDNRIKCFVCQRSYGVFSLLSRYDPGRLEELAHSASIQGMPSSERKAPLRIPPLSSLDFSKGLTVELLDQIINYGKS